MQSTASVSGPWAVYQTTLRGKQVVMRCICEQREWDVMEKAQPGCFPLIRGWITSESEAERLAREAPAPASPLMGAVTPLPRRGSVG